MNLLYCAYTLVCVSFLSGCSSRPVGAGGAPPNFDRSVNRQLTLSQPGVQIMLTTTGTPGFSDLPTALNLMHGRKNPGRL